MSVLKILLINFDDSGGGAAVACMRLLETLNQQPNISAKMLVQEKKTAKYAITEYANSRLKKRWAFLRFIKERLYFRLYERNKDIRFAFSPAIMGVDISQHPLVKEADILHIHWINFGFLSIRSLQQLFQLGKPIVFTMHDMWLLTGGCHHSGSCKNYEETCGNCIQYLRNPSSKDLSNQVWYRKNTIFNKADSTKIKVIGCSKWLSKRAKDSSLLKRFSIESIANPIDTNLFSPQPSAEARKQLGLPIDKKLILFVAMKVSVIWKGFSYFQEALEILHTQTTDNKAIELIILGESSVELIEKLPFKSHVLGRISDFQKIALVYAAADVFVIPSIQENLPNTIMESMACGTPVVGFEVGGIPEMIEHQQTGFLAKYKSAESLSEGINWVLNEADTTVLSENARRKVTNHYSQEVIVKKYLQVYNDLTEAQSSGL